MPSVVLTYFSGQIFAATAPYSFSRALGFLLAKILAILLASPFKFLTSLGLFTFLGELIG